MTVLLFDIDGTLLSCGGAGRAAVNDAFAECLGIQDALNFSLGGMTDRRIMRQALHHWDVPHSDALVDTLILAYLRHLPARLERATGFEVFDDAIRTASQAHDRGFVVGLGTGNVEAGARTKLRRAGLDQLFSFGGFGDDGEPREDIIAAGLLRARQLKPSQRAIVIGDTPADVAAARACGAECLAVATGTYRVEALNDAGADLVVENLGDSRVWEFLERV